MRGGPDDVGGGDQGVNAGFPAGGQYPPPPPALCPPPDPPPDRVPVPEPVGQVPPRNPGLGHIQDRVDEPPVGRVRPSARQQSLDPAPVRVTDLVSPHVLHLPPLGGEEP